MKSDPPLEGGSKRPCALRGGVMAQHERTCLSAAPRWLRQHPLGEANARGRAIHRVLDGTWRDVTGSARHRHGAIDVGSEHLIRGCVSDTRQTMQFDVVIVGAGPAGLAAAIRLKQLAQNS